MIRNIIWDVDGTLFDTYPAISKAFQLAVQELGSDAPLDWINDAARRSNGYCVSTLAEKCHLNEDEIAKKFEKYYDKALPEEQFPFPSVIKVCQYISSTAGKNLIVSHRDHLGVTELLTAHHMTDFFSGWICRDDGYPKKPDPAAFEATLRNHSLLKEETIAVGDRDIDILAGQAAGIATCLYNSEPGGSNPTLSITHFDELYVYLLEQHNPC